MNAVPRVVVVGGGLAGLVAARHLAAGGVEVTVLERRADVGGRVRTVERDGYRFDRGFQVLFAAYPAVQRELDLDALAVSRFAPGAVLAGPNHRSILGDPLRDPRALPATLFNPDVSIRDAVRVARLRLELARTDPETIFEGADESIDSFLRRRGFSDRFVERFAAPFYGGITLDRSLSTSRRVFEYTFRALAIGDAAVPAAGMGAIPAQLADRARAAGATIETDAPVESISTEGDGVAATTSGRPREADAVVVATDPPAARDLTGVDSIPTAGRGCVTQYYRLPGRARLGTGNRLVLNVVGGADGSAGPNHVVPHSAVVPEYAPADETMIGATFLGEREARDEELARRTRSALESWFPERSFDGFELLRTDRIGFAQFDQPPGVHDRLPDVRDPDGPVYLAGDYTRWSSIQGAMESGRRAAGAVVEDLSS